MQLHIPAVHSSSARAYPLGVSHGKGDVLTLHSTWGSASLILPRGAQPMRGVNAQWIARGAEQARAFVDDLAGSWQMRPTEELRRDSTQMVRATFV